LKDGFILASAGASRRAIVRGILAVSRKLTAPKITRILVGPFLRADRHARASDLAVGDARSILVVRLDAIGDLVLMSPFLRELRRSNPVTWITLVVDPRFVNLMELCPHVNAVLTFDPQYPGRTGLLGLHFRALRLARVHLWPRRFDLALLPRWDVDDYHSAFVAYFSGAPCRIGYSENVSPMKQRMNRDLDSLFTRTLFAHAPKHEVERNLDFLREVGGMVTDDHLELWLSEEDREAARAALASRGVTGGDLLIGIAPGAGHPKRLWPLGRFIEVGRFLVQELGARLLIVGGPEDRELAFRLQQKLGAAAFSFAGETTLRQTAALLEHAQLMVANDSGPMHLAAAAGAAVVEISCHPVGAGQSHPNSPVRFHPWTAEYLALQPEKPSEPCSSACNWYEPHCILGVSVDAVHEAARTLLQRRQSTQREKLGAHHAV